MRFVGRGWSFVRTHVSNRDLHIYGGWALITGGAIGAVGAWGMVVSGACLFGIGVFGISPTRS